MINAQQASSKTLDNLASLAMEQEKIIEAKIMAAICSGNFEIDFNDVLLPLVRTKLLALGYSILPINDGVNIDWSI